MIAQHGFAGGDFLFYMMRLHPTQDGGFVPAETEIEGVAFHSGEGEVDGEGVAMRSEAVDHGAAGVAQAEEFADLVEGFAGGIVTGLAEQAVDATLAHLEEMGVAAAGHEGEGGELDRRAVAARFENDGVDVTFDVVDADEGHAGGEGQALGVGEPDEQRADEPRTHGDGDGRKVLQAGVGAEQGFAHHRNDGAKVFARGELRDYAAVLAMHGDLRGHYARKHGIAAGHDGGGGFIAGGFDAENTHSSYLSAGSWDSRMRRSMGTLTGLAPRRAP